jgi:hypothetical protein
VDFCPIDNVQMTGKKVDNFLLLEKGFHEPEDEVSIGGNFFAPKGNAIKYF